MRYQDYITRVTRAAADEAFRYIDAVPEEKAQWKPSEGGRSVLDIARELARTPVWAYDILEGKEQDWSEEAMAKEQAEMAKFTTLQGCKEECDRQLARLFDLFAKTPDEKLSETRWLPYDGGRDFTFEEMMDYPRWNYTYHLGQVAYIQTLYGDKEMH